MWLHQSLLLNPRVRVIHSVNTMDASYRELSYRIDNESHYVSWDELHPPGGPSRDTN